MARAHGAAQLFSGRRQLTGSQPSISTMEMKSVREKQSEGRETTTILYHCFKKQTNRELSSRSLHVAAQARGGTGGGTRGHRAADWQISSLCYIRHFGC